ncbi:XdhC family protein [Bacillus sp. FJAT-29814]|uniref:XdhC family protein n=1 Tax=Bacillus sp. FJAT-29814 TaxID=1729688 RepID=UPI000833E147|nr:XdhC family protein [Bacillus sp. FJAT-29814]
MLSNRQITELLSSMIQNGQPGVLATVVTVQGSAYKREGAKMIIEPNGDYHGMISGGCLEADVAASAEEVFSSGNPILKKYELDEDLVWGLGLGCPGTVEILIEPIDSSRLGEQMADAYTKNQAIVVCKLLESEERPLLVTEANVFGDNWADEILQESTMMMAAQKLAQQTSTSETIFLTKKTGEEVRVFFDVTIPPPKLFLFGAGHDALPLADFGCTLGFQTTIIDPRPAFNTRERFPTAHSLLGETGQIDSRTYCVIMNHHLERDMDSLAVALKSDAPYVGLLGPRIRRAKLMNHLKEQGTTFSNKQLEKLHSPIGLDIGAETPEEIALSIMAEITAFRNGHQGGFLKEKAFIHKPTRLLAEKKS